MTIVNPYGADLQAIVNSWSPRLNKLPTADERTVLEIMYENALQTGQVEIAESSLVTTAVSRGIVRDALETILSRLGTAEGSKNCIQRGHQRCKMRAAGWEVFESRRDVLQRLVLVLAKMHEEKQSQVYFGVPSIARAVGFGDYSITGFYMYKLADPELGVVELKKRPVSNFHSRHEISEYRLTPRGIELAAHLLRASQKPA